MSQNFKEVTKLNKQKREQPQYEGYKPDLVLNKSEVQDLLVISSDKEKKLKQLEELRKAKKMLIEEEMALMKKRAKMGIKDNYMDCEFKNNQAVGNDQ